MVTMRAGDLRDALSGCDPDTPITLAYASTDYVPDWVVVGVDLAPHRVILLCTDLPRGAPNG